MNKKSLFKIFTLLIIMCLSSAHDNAHAARTLLSVEQILKQKKITIGIKNAPLKTILYEIQKQSGVSFIFNSDVDSKTLTNLSLEVKNITVEEALKQLFAPTDYTYNVIGETVTIQKKVKTKSNSNPPSTYNGKVLDNKGNPVTGATILVVGTTNGAISNEKGEFNLKTPIGSEIEISFTGYKAQFITLNESEKDLIIKMELDELVVEDVVVNGFFTRRQSGFAGTNTIITKEDLKKVSTGNIFTTISTLDSGFKINENNLDGSNPNVLPDFTIRGKGSFQNGSTAPIFILDGFEVSSQKIFDMDINRIETITLLKDASATILYGSRASNGVIVIETTSPKPGQLRISYDFKPTIGIVNLSDYDLMNAKEKLEYERLANVYSSSYGYDQESIEKLYYSRLSNVLRGVDTYWLSQPVRNSFSHAHSIFIEGGAESIRYGIDLGYNQNNGVMKESGRDRFNFGFSLVYRIKDKVTIKNYISYDNINSYNSPYGSYSAYGKLNPYEQPRNSYGEVVPLLSDGGINPLYDAELPNRDNTKSQAFNEQFSVDWRINDNFRLKGQLSILKETNKDDRYRSPFASEYVLRTTYNPETMSDYIPIEKRGQLSKSDGEGLNVTGNFTFNYDKIINKHIITVGLGSEIISSENSGYGFSVTGFADERYSDAAYAIQYLENSRASSHENAARSIGFFLNANYIFDNRFFADLSFRYDGSSRFGADKRYAPFYSIGTGWNLHNEKFLKDGFFNMIKLRYSWGVTGNNEFSSYQAKTTYQFNTARLYDNIPTISLMGYGNPHLKWQTQYQHNIGFDLRFVENRYRLSFNYYHKTTEGMLTNITVAPSLGLESNSYIANLGKIRNRGFELNANAVILRRSSSDFEWAVSFQGATNKSILLEISKELKNTNNENNKDRYTPKVVYEEGESMTVLKAVRSLGIDPSTGKEIFLTKNNLISYQWNANDKVLCGDTEPKFFGNIGTNLFYRGWNLNLSLRYRMGADYYNQTLASRVEGANPKENADRRVLNDRWKKVGDRALYKNISEYTSTYVSTRFIQKENRLEAGSFSLSYEFDKKLIKKLKAQTLRLSFYANDFLYLSTIKQERGIDYPFQRSFVFGLNISF